MAGQACLLLSASGLMPRRVSVLLPALLALSAACSDGYPPRDAQPLEPQIMTNVQRLEAMNVLGQDAHETRRWNYSLDDSCQLTVVALRQGIHPQAQTLPLRGALVQVKADQLDDTHDVRIASAEGPPVSILESEQWGDAILMSGLVQHVLRDCASAAPSEAATLQPAA